MGNRRTADTSGENLELEFDKKQLARVRERVLEAEKGKLHLEYPSGINNKIEQIIREEID